ncbi:MAG: DinB family protein [Candidatus Hodarchaeales archaeon]|jgi:uncharacterized damage-inducible protein DinB
MKNTDVKGTITKIVKKIRLYGQWMVDDLSYEELNWIPPESNARTIQSYFRHIINAEIYWLKHLGDESFTYEPRTVEFRQLQETYQKLGQYLKSKINNAEEAELEIRTPSYEGNELQNPGTFSWIVLRTSLHAIHHFGQISHIRYSMDKPPNPDLQKVTWGETMDIIAKAMLI